MVGSIVDLEANRRFLFQWDDSWDNEGDYFEGEIVERSKKATKLKWQNKQGQEYVEWLSSDKVKQIVLIELLEVTKSSVGL